MSAPQVASCLKSLLVVIASMIFLSPTAQASTQKQLLLLNVSVPSADGLRGLTGLYFQANSDENGSLESITSSLGTETFTVTADDLRRGGKELSYKGVNFLSVRSEGINEVGEGTVHLAISDRFVSDRNASAFTFRLTRIGSTKRFALVQKNVVVTQASIALSFDPRGSNFVSLMFNPPKVVSSKLESIGCTVGNVVDFIYRFGSIEFLLASKCRITPKSLEDFSVLVSSVIDQVDGDTQRGDTYFDYYIVNRSTAEMNNRILEALKNLERLGVDFAGFAKLAQVAEFNYVNDVLAAPIKKGNRPAFDFLMSKGFNRVSDGTVVIAIQNLFQMSTEKYEVVGSPTAKYIAEKVLGMNVRKPSIGDLLHAIGRTNEMLPVTFQYITDTEVERKGWLRYISLQLQMAAKLSLDPSLKYQTEDPGENNLIDVRQLFSEFSGYGNNFNFSEKEVNELVKTAKANGF